MYSMARRHSAQRGMGMLGFIVIIALVAFFATIVLKVGPLYLDFWTLRTIMEEVKANPQQIEGGARGITAAIDKRLNVNSVYGRKGSDFKVKKVDGGLYRVTLDYEDRVHLFFNVDAVAAFKHEIEVQLQP
ncbi:DUF4845 domain-containing protein [Thiorhodococcus mannitoliphagus]|uniref:DUF4845 domain-containing protein n=1 Tax=Thiorhodococcus mannitoliphagus TaxID=329406 RepID=A0A6P1DPA0_9GAMM|nr:DUF4845 domain-containing protein [Thiorhodococcus mannitoliphagus]NEX20097.1 DUF4845 domain-containing protein [Thiorhodococcus mannitoliphagus]